jgi:hypothetical protein
VEYVSRFLATQWKARRENTSAAPVGIGLVGVHFFLFSLPYSFFKFFHIKQVPFWILQFFDMSTARRKVSIPEKVDW